MKSTLLFFFLVCASLLKAYAQTDTVNTPNRLSLFGGGAASLAFSGYNISATAEARLRRHAIYLGPKYSISDSYALSKGPLGFIAGYKVNLFRV